MRHDIVLLAGISLGIAGARITLQKTITILRCGFWRRSVTERHQNPHFDTKMQALYYVQVEFYGALQVFQGATDNGHQLHLPKQVYHTEWSLILLLVHILVNMPNILV